jgi:hypothetical protein
MADGRVHSLGIRDMGHACRRLEITFISLLLLIYIPPAILLLTVVHCVFIGC